MPFTLLGGFFVCGVASISGSGEPENAYCLARKDEFSKIKAKFNKNS